VTPTEVCFGIIAFCAVLLWRMEASFAQSMMELCQRAQRHMSVANDIIALEREQNRLLREQVDGEGDEWKR
jgi:hypothetical protein